MYVSSSHPGVENVLSDREASDAIAVMKNSKEMRPGQPWFAQVRTQMFLFLF